MDDIRIYNRTLGSNEVQALYLDSASSAAAPASLTASAGNQQVVLSWANVSGVTGYDLERATQSGGPYTSIAKLFSTSYTDVSVTNGNIYYYTVAAGNSLGDGTNSAAVSATPSLASSLTTWFAADVITGLANGSAVSNWTDSSGNGDDASQSNGIQRPAYIINALNGLPVVRFDAASSNYLAFSRPVQDDFTLITVYQSSQNNQGTGTAFFNGAGLVNGDQPGAQNDFGISLITGGQVAVGTGNPDTTINSGGGFNDGKPHVMTFKRIKNTGTLLLYMDGIQVAAGAGGTQSLTAATQLDMGAVPSGGGFLTGDIAEVKIFNSALSDLDRNAEENTLECKYGIAASDPPLAIPAGLNGVPGNRVISLNWSVSSGAAAYNLSSSLSAGGPFLPLVGNLTASSYADMNAVSGQTNYYEVTAVNGCGVSLGSAPVGIYLPKPSLFLMNATANTLNISWPSWASDWSLYFATNLNPPVVWYPATDAVGSNNGQFIVTIPAGSGTRFFRLSAP